MKTFIFTGTGLGIMSLELRTTALDNSNLEVSPGFSEAVALEPLAAIASFQNGLQS